MIKSATIESVDVTYRVDYSRDIFGNYADTIDDITILSVEWDTMPEWIAEINSTYSDPERAIRDYLWSFVCDHEQVLFA
jgi:hypothetical protein